MPPDPTHTLTDAILTATPEYATRYGERRRVAARQAAAALRWLAEHCLNTEDSGTEDGLWFCADLRDLAHQLDTQEPDRG